MRHRLWPRRQQYAYVSLYNGREFPCSTIHLQLYPRVHNPDITQSKKLNHPSIYHFYIQTNLLPDMKLQLLTLIAIVATATALPAPKAAENTLEQRGDEECASKPVGTLCTAELWGIAVPGACVKVNRGNIVSSFFH